MTLTSASAKSHSEVESCPDGEEDDDDDDDGGDDDDGDDDNKQKFDHLVLWHTAHLVPHFGWFSLEKSGERGSTGKGCGS